MRTFMLLVFVFGLTACHGTRPIGDDNVTWLPDGTFIWGDDVRSSDLFEPGAKILTRGKYRIVRSGVPLQDLRKKSVLRKHLAHGDVIAELVDEQHVKAVGPTGVEQVGSLAGGAGSVMVGAAALDGQFKSRITNKAGGATATAEADSESQAMSAAEAQASAIQKALE